MELKCFGLALNGLLSRKDKTMKIYLVKQTHNEYTDSAYIDEKVAWKRVFELNELDRTDQNYYGLVVMEVNMTKDSDSNQDHTFQSILDKAIEWKDRWEKIDIDDDNSCESLVFYFGKDNINYVKITKYYQDKKYFANFFLNKSPISRYELPTNFCNTYLVISDYISNKELKAKEKEFCDLFLASFPQDQH